jgi:uncharacterized protein YdeI (YjbR/CyaY-like superfamily)
MISDMEPVFFADQFEFRKWLERNHDSVSELLVGFYKVGSGKPGMTWSQSVDQALCFGWIDGIRRSVDGESYCIRFTPRRPSSIWSRINIQKVEMLQANGLMTKAGLDVYLLRKDSKTGIYSFEKSPAKLNPEFEEEFKKNKTAWEFFVKQAPSYKKTIINWVQSAKQEPTRLSRLNKLILSSENHKRIF